MHYVPPHIQALKPYAAGKTLEELAEELQVPTIAKLASNENSLGPSPKALSAMREHADFVHLYPNPSSIHLKNALSKKLNVSSDRLFCANGIDAILAYAMMSFSSEGDEVLTSDGTFIGIYVNAQKLGRRVKTVPLKNWAYDLPRFAKRIGPKTKIIYLANPNNPTGSMITTNQLEAFLIEVPREVIVILDEAYYEFACHHPNYPNGLDYDRTNLIVTRTFSKAYGLAGLRVGYAVSTPEIAAELSKVKLPFEPTRLGQIAAAAALDDIGFLEKTQNQTQEGLEQFRACFSDLGIDFYSKTGGNSLFYYFETAEKAKTFYEACFKRGLVTRPLIAFGIPQGLRINAGNPEENQFAVKVMTELMKKE